MSAVSGVEEVVSAISNKGEACRTRRRTAMLLMRATLPTRLPAAMPASIAATATAAMMVTLVMTVTPVTITAYSNKGDEGIMDVRIGSRIHISQWLTWKESVLPTNLLVRFGRISGPISGLCPLCPNMRCCVAVVAAAVTVDIAAPTSARCC